MTKNNVLDLLKRSGTVLAAVIAATITATTITASSSIATPTLATDTITEQTAAHGVIVDSTTIKDGGVSGTGDLVTTTAVRGAKVYASNTGYFDSIAEYTTSAGTTIGGVKLANNAVATDTITEKTTNAGVTIGGGALCKGGVCKDVVGGSTTTAPEVMSLSAQFPNYSTSSLSEELASTYTLPASSWNTTGQALRVRAWGTAAGNTNGKSIKLRLGGLGGTIVGSCTQNTATDLVWVVTWTVSRTGSNAQSTTMECAGNTTRTIAAATSTITEGGSTILDVTLTTGANPGDLTLKGATYEWLQ